jgi:3-oxoacyl-[acyl-carrier-protein] synthase-3
MAFLEFENVRIAGISAAVPKKIEKPKSRSSDYTDEEFRKGVGILERRLDDTFTTSDLCYYGAERLIADLKWDKQEIDAIIFVSQFPDYVLPATAPILQDRLGLSKECYAADISLGCSGWVYGLSVAAGLLNNGSVKKVLLMAGDARRLVEATLGDPLFGFAGTVTAIEYKPSDTGEGVRFHFGSDGSGYDVIIIPEGGARNGFTEKTLDFHDCEDGIRRNGLMAIMKGMDVFSFAISTAPKSVRKLADKYSINLEEVDYLVLHQANKQINDKIAKKLNFGPERVPESLTYFGNTSSASIPMSIVTGIKSELRNELKRFVACGFGVGLSWGSVYFVLDHCLISSLVEV